MDRYLRGRKHDSPVQGPSWWDRMFTPKQPDMMMEEFTPEETAKLRVMEQEIREGEQQLERAADPVQEHQLEVEQEKKISLYQQFLKLFKREHRLEDAYEHMEEIPPEVDQSVTDDFKALAMIQLRWFDHLPTRAKEEFKQSPDYPKYVEILTRRGVARKKE